MDEQTRKLKADLLAGEILGLAHASLLLRLRFMEGALCRLEFAPMPRGTLWTDGRRFSYAPMHVLLRYRQERANPARDYLHAVLHCVFRHMYLHTRVQPQAWSLACDMVAEDLITDLRLRTTAVEREAETWTDAAARALGRWWWLRTPGFDNSFAAALTPEGKIVRIGSFADAEDYAVRPAMWIRTDEDREQAGEGQR